MLTRLVPLCVVLFAVGGLLEACPRCCHDEKDPVKITMVVILASEEGSTIDPKLKGIAQEVQKLHPNLKSFKIHHMENRSIKAGSKVSLPAVEKKNVDIVIKHGADKDNRVGISVEAPTVGEIEYQTVCGKFLPIVTRYKTKTKEQLILAIRVQPCRGD